MAKLLLITKPVSNGDGTANLCCSETLAKQWDIGVKQGCVEADHFKYVLVELIFLWKEIETVWMEKDNVKKSTSKGEVCPKWGGHNLKS